jgi:hypothetical protein
MAMFGATVSYLSYFEAKYLASEVESYFQEGIEVKRGDVVFDVGANIGVFSLWVHQKCGGDVVVYAFEPLPPIFDVLDRNFKRLGNSKLRSFAFGLSDSQQTLDFTYFPAEPIWSSAASDGRKSWLALQGPRMKKAILLSRREQSYPALKLLPGPWRPPALRLILEIGLRFHLRRVARTAQTFKAEVKTVSDVMRDEAVQHIDLLKVDVEGSEVKLLEGIEHEDWQKIRQVVAEIDAYDRDAERVAQLLRKQGFPDVVLKQSPAQRELDIGLVFARR